MTAATAWAPAGRATPTASRTTTPSSGGRSARTAGRASPTTSRSAREPPTPTIRGTGSTTATTAGCRSTAGSPIPPGRTTPTAPGRTPTARCTNSTSTPQPCPCRSSGGGHRLGQRKGNPCSRASRTPAPDPRRGAGGRTRGPGPRRRQQLGLDIERRVHQSGGEFADDRGRLSGAAGADVPEPGHLPGRLAGFQPFRVVDRGQAGHREPRRQLEVLLRQLLAVLPLLPP